MVGMPSCSFHEQVKFLLRGVSKAVEDLKRLWDPIVNANYQLDKFSLVVVWSKM